MTIRFCAVLVLVQVLALFPVAAREGGQDDQDWIRLFDGRTLDGWVPKIAGYEAGVNFGDTFRVEAGVLKVAYDRYERFDNRFGHLFYRTPFSRYRLIVEYRFTGQQSPGAPEWAYRNSGIMVHGQPVETMGLKQDFPISVEVQLLGGRGDGKPRPTMNVCTPGTHIVRNGTLDTTHCINSTSPTFDGDQWVSVELEVHGHGRFIHRVNGQDVLTYEQPQVGGEVVTNHDPAAKRDGQPLSGGSISLQSEGHPIEFRRVDLLNLVGCMDPKALNYRTYVEESDPASCRYR